MMGQAHPTSVSQSTRVPRIAVLAALLAAMLLLVAFRRHAFEVPLERDEGNYAYIAGRLLEGDRLYVEVWDHQPFGVFVLFAGIAAVFGHAPDVFRWLAVVFCLLGQVLIFLSLRRWRGDFAAILGACLFALVSADPGTAGEGCNRELFINPLVLAAWVMVMPNRSQPAPVASGVAHPPAKWVLAGILLAFASALKTVVAVHWVALAAWGVISNWPSSSVPRNGKPGGAALLQSAAVVMLLGLGPFLLWVGSWVFFSLTGRGAEFAEAVFGFNLGYAEQPTGLAARWLEFFAPSRSPHVFESALPLWIATTGAIVWLFWVFLRRRCSWTSWILALALGNYLAIGLPGQFWPHYYHLMIPVAVIAVAAAADDFATALHASRYRIPKFAVALLLLSVMFIRTYDQYLALPPTRITSLRYRGLDWWAMAQADNVRQVTQPEDEIFVYGNDASIYYYAQRRCASRYTMVTALNPEFSGFERHRRLMLEDLERRRPRVMLVVLGVEPFPEWEAFLLRHYDAVGWDFRDRPPYDPVLMVVADRLRPIPELDWNWDSASLVP